MENSTFKAKMVANLIWRFAERCGAQGVAFIVSIVLARLLEPEDYGIISLVTIFISIIQIFVDSGLGNALIQKRVVDDLDYSTVFYCNIILCVVLYLVLFLCAPFIAGFYANTELTLIIRVLGLTIIISGIKGIQQAYVSREMMFRHFFFATLGGTLGAAAVGIFLAYNGFGVWALIGQQIFNTTVDTIILWSTVKWRPKRRFSFERLRGLFSYGSKLLVSSLINTIYNDLRQLIIGKFYSSADLAFYNRGRQFPKFVVENINSSIDSVLLPVLANNQNNRERMKRMMRRSIMTSSYIMWPFMFGLMAVGENLIHILLTDKWMPALPFLYIFCFVDGMQPIHTANLNAIKAVGESGLFLKMEIIKKMVGICIILITMNINVLAIGIGSVFYTIFASIVNSFPNKKILGYSYFEQIKDIIPSFILSIVMAITVYCLPLSVFSNITQLVIQILAGAAIYLMGSIIFKLDSYLYLKSTVIEFLRS